MHAYAGQLAMHAPSVFSCRSACLSATSGGLVMSGEVPEHTTAAAMSYIHDEHHNRLTVMIGNLGESRSLFVQLLVFVKLIIIGMQCYSH